MFKPTQTDKEINPNPKGADVNLHRLKLSIDQQYALDKFEQGHNILLTGPGGVGKTQLIHRMVESTTKSIQVCALTGCASVLLGCNAKTIHSWSGIKLAKGPAENIINKVLTNKHAKKNWKNIKILIVDETSMMSKKIFNILERTARLIRGNNEPFGGIQVIFSADFYQLPPVPTLNEPDTGEFCFESDRWNVVFPWNNHIELKTMFRQSDPIYIDILSQIRRGSLSPENIDILKNYVKRPEPINVVTKLFPLRARADYVNQLMFDKIDSPIIEFKLQTNRKCTTYAETGKPIDANTLELCMALTPLEINYELEQLIANTPCIEKLELKRDSIVMCTANIDMENGICNGSQGIILDFASNGAPIVKFVNGLTKTLELHSWQSSEYPTISISQYPLQLAWALTIHKIQGATLDMAQIDVGNGIFEYGQTYVALSRIKTLDGLYLANFNPTRIKAHPKVKQFYDNISANQSSETDTKSDTKSDIKIIKL